MANLMSTQFLAKPAVSSVARAAKMTQMTDAAQQFQHYRDRLKAAMKAQRVSNEELAARLGIHHVTVSKLRSGKMKLTEEWRQKIAAEMDMSLSDLFGDTPIVTVSPPAERRIFDTRKGSPRRAKERIIIDPVGRRMLEVWGLAAGSLSGQTRISDDPIQQVAAPPALVNVIGAYVLMTKGESMIPRYFPNDYLYVNPHQEVRVNDHVIIQIRAHDGHIETYVKRYDGADSESIFASQYNPAGRLTFKKQYVEYVHRILPVNELMNG